MTNCKIMLWLFKIRNSKLDKITRESKIAKFSFTFNKKYSKKIILKAKQKRN